jgi:hypothetical protein
MTECVVTSFSAAGERLYGRRMVETFRRHWPAGTELVVYVDAPTRLRGATVRLTTDLPEWVACARAWRDDLEVHGVSTPARPHRKPYSYRFDAARFAVKVFVWRDAALRTGAGILTWLDGDTVTTAAVPAGFPTTLLEGADVAYLGRGRMHPENGYVGFRVPEALPLLEWCCAQYHSGAFRAIASGWTDCHVLRAGIEAGLVRARDLTSHRYEGRSHIWPVSPLAPYLDHLKGARKRRGASA